ncbi:MAG: type II toxin-antitoxin system RelE/ParE family toxin [bacterium]
MKKKWVILYFEDKNRICDIDCFLDGLKEKERAKAIAWIDKLGEEGNELKRPFADYLQKGIYELRISLNQKNVRILYFFVFKNFIILSHVFRKNTKRVPEKEIARAILNKAKFLSEQTETEIRRKYEES